MRKNITIIAKMQADGKIIPLKLIWENNQVFEIDKDMKLLTEKT